MSEIRLTAPEEWGEDVIKVCLVGCGGTGSEVLDILSQFHLALQARGSAGLHVTAWDAASVKTSNIVRQRFWPCDIGQNKAICLINRYNMLLGTDWDAHPENLKFNSDFDLLITAVDVASARCEFADEKGWLERPWLDFGNSVDFGQAVLGTIGGKRKKPDFKNVVEHYPDLRKSKGDRKESCSTLESLLTQDVLINRAVAVAGMSMLWELLKQGWTNKNLCLVDLNKGTLKSFGFEREL